MDDSEEEAGDAVELWLDDEVIAGSLWEDSIFKTMGDAVSSCLEQSEGTKPMSAKNRVTAVRLADGSDGY